MLSEHGIDGQNKHVKIWRLSNGIAKAIAKTPQDSKTNICLWLSQPLLYGHFHAFLAATVPPTAFPISHLIKTCFQRTIQHSCYRVVKAQENLMVCSRWGPSKGILNGDKGKKALKTTKINV